MALIRGPMHEKRVMDGDLGHENEGRRTFSMVDPKGAQKTRRLRRPIVWRIDIGSEISDAMTNESRL